MDKARPAPIEVTVTFLEMQAPPAHYPPLPYNRQIALLRTKDMPLHFYRYLTDRVGRKWHWVTLKNLGPAAGKRETPQDSRTS